MVTVTLQRTGGSFTDSVFNGTYSDPVVYMEGTSIKYGFTDSSLIIEIPEVDAGTQSRTIGGKFKRQRKKIEVTALIIADANNTVSAKIAKVWNIAEYGSGSPASVYLKIRDNWMFGVQPTGTGKCKIVDLQIEDNATMGEPSSLTSSSTEPIMVQVKFTVVQSES